MCVVLTTTSRIIELALNDAIIGKPILGLFPDGASRMIALAVAAVSSGRLMLEGGCLHAASLVTL